MRFSSSQNGGNRRNSIVMDIFSREKRSQVMAAIRSRGNRNTEVRLAAILRRNGISGWRRHQKLIGNPDFVFPAIKLAVFVDGCFWHGCFAHGHRPRSNQSYWLAKLERNRARDRTNTKLLRRKGWIVLRIWEHELRSEKRIVTRCRKALCEASRRRPRSVSGPLLPARSPVNFAPRSPKLAPKRRKSLRQRNLPGARGKKNDPGPVENPTVSA